jgi:hypothetical protein
VQISAGGKTTSLGDHDIEEQAARAFDRASINKSGTAAKTNFPIQEYATELEQLTSTLHPGQVNPTGVYSHTLTVYLARLHTIRCHRNDDTIGANKNVERILSPTRT